MTNTVIVTHEDFGPQFFRALYSKQPDYRAHGKRPDYLVVSATDLSDVFKQNLDDGKIWARIDEDYTTIVLGG